MTIPPGDRGFWLTSEIAPLLGCCSRTVAAKVDAGLIAGFRLPGSRRRVVRHEDLRRFLESRPEYRGLLKDFEVYARGESPMAARA